MIRDVIEFDSFKKNFIDAPWGYFPVCSAITEDDNGEYENSVNVDLICEWRLPDGKIKFIVVTFETQEQLHQISNWILKGAEALKNEIIKDVMENVVDIGKGLFK